MTGPERRREEPLRVAWVVAALAAAGVLVLSALVLLGVRWWGGGECAVAGRGRIVELGTHDAELAGAVTAWSVRRREPLRRATQRVSAALDVGTDDARIIASALTGRSPQALTCRHGGADEPEPDTLNAVGLTGRAARVRRDLERAFGPQKLGGFAPGGVRTGHMVGSAHYEGRAVDVFYRPVTGRNRRHGWATAQYLVANAERLAIDTVIYDGRIWTARRSFEGWRSYRVDTTGRSAEVVAVLEHRDHVHVDVAD